MHPTLEEQADSFAQSFPAEDREPVRDWYLAQLRQDRTHRRWRAAEAGLTVFLLVAVLPALALWAYFTLP